MARNGGMNEPLLMHFNGHFNKQRARASRRAEQVGGARLTNLACGSNPFRFTYLECLNKCIKQIFANPAGNHKSIKV